MNSLHPMVVHFPIALLITGFLFASLAMFCKRCGEGCSTESQKPSCVLKVTYWLLSLGTLGALGAVVSGLFFTTMVSPIKDLHQMLAISTLVVSIISSCIYIFYIFKARRNSAVHWIAYILYAVSVVLVSITGHYGGMMVY